MSILKDHGLYKLNEGVWQIRGFDVSNMTLISGKTGWIIIDPLTRKESAAAGLKLANEQLGTRPVVAVIYTHSHSDHFGGAFGVTSREDVTAGKVAIIAPEHFTQEAVSENVMAGPAMGRRAAYLFGIGQKPGPQGSIGSGIGRGIAGGESGLIVPGDVTEPRLIFPSPSASLPSLPAENRMHIVGWSRTNSSTWRDWLSYTPGSPPPHELVWMRAPFEYASWNNVVRSLGMPASR